MNKFKVIFAPSLKETVEEEGRTILAAARSAGVYVDSHCNGKGSCGKCKIRVVSGDAGPFTADEARFIKDRDRAAGYRLACMARIGSDVTAFVPGENVIKSGVAKKLFAKRAESINPAVKSYVVSFPSKKADGKTGGNRHAYLDDIAGLLAGKHGLGNLTFDVAALQEAAHAVKTGEGKVTVLVWMDREILSVRPGSRRDMYGLALDVGTTTVAVYLCDLCTGNIVASGSVTNPQVLFGTDVMSRIAYSVDHPGVGVKSMQRELLQEVNRLVDEMTSKNKLNPNQIIDMTLVGNTVMHHIALGIAPDHLGLWPFSPSVQKSVDVKARDLGVLINQAAYVHALPVEAGFVGADNVAVLLSEKPHRQNEISLTIDLGTNGELVMGNRERLISASCATGPALEGAHISSGMRATVGAIEKVRIDPESFEASYAVVGHEGWFDGKRNPGGIRPIGLCGSGIIDTVAQLFKTGLIGEGGAFVETKETTRLRKGASGITEYVIAWKDETGTGSDIVLTQKDIRQIQLAKGALQGGCRVLMSHFGLKSIDRVVIAGAFGMHIDKENALVLGLFPPCEPDGIFVVGNAAGHGAYLALLDRETRVEANKIAAEVEHIELALDERFQREFMNSLSIPYKSEV